MAPLSPSDVRACVHPRLPLRFALAVLCAVLLAPLIIVLSLLGLVSLLLFWIVVLSWLSVEVLFAYMTENCILVSALNYPRIDTLAAEVKTLLAVRRDFQVFVFEQGQFNAFMLRMFRRRAIFLNSEILETGVSDDEVRWLIGRFVGYWRSQQDAGFLGWMIRIARKFGVFNFFILPYERAMVYTGDRLGLACIGGDIATAISAMQKVLVGRQLGYSVNPIGVVEQRRLTKGSLFGFLARVGSAFPHTIARYVDLIAFARLRFREPFARFEAANPGLAQDLDELSGERTSGASLAKGFGFLLLWLVAGLATVAIWALLIGFIVTRTGGSLSGLFPTPPTIPAEPSPYEQSAPAPAPPPAPEPQPAPPQQPTPPPQQSAAPPAQGGEIHGAIFAQQPDAEDYARVYPESAKADNLSGSATLRCTVTNDDGLTGCRVVDETPPNSGFGEAALQLVDRIKLAPRTSDGTAVEGGNISVRIPFSPP